MATTHVDTVVFYLALYTFLFVSIDPAISSVGFLDGTSLFSVLPESARWMISKGYYARAEQLLRQMAETNRRPFDAEAFAQLKQTQEKVMNVIS
jgi:hypothetical protein